MGPWQLVPVDDVALEVQVAGQGEPVVVIQTALTADELQPLADRIAVSGDYQVIHYHRRGYAGSGPARRLGSVAAEASDCRALLDVLHLAPAHVVGVSFSAAIALTLAASYPEAVRSLTVIEPPPAGVPEFRAANTRLLAVFAQEGPRVALDDFLTLVVGPDWRRECERDQPGSVVAMERDAATFFAGDLSALLAWSFGAEEAAQVRCPVLCVGGSGSGSWFEAARARIAALLPAAQGRTVHGAGHLLATSHPDEAAALVLEFLRSTPRA